MPSTVVYKEKDYRSGPSASVLVALRRITRAIDLHSRQLVHQLGVTGPQVVVLHEVARKGAMPVGNLAKAVSLSHATVTGIVARLEKRGLVERRGDDEDRRRVLVEVTPDGQELLRSAPLPIQECFVTEFERLPEWEQSQILSSLQRVVAMMEAADLEAPPLLATSPLEAATA